MTLKRLCLCLALFSSLSYAQYWETQKGLDLLDQNPQKAQSFFEKALEYNSNDGRLHYNLGNSYVKSNQYQRAIQSYETALKTIPVPYQTATHYNLGTAALHHNQLDKAIKHLKIALKNNPNFEQARQNLEVALTQQQNQQDQQNTSTQNQNDPKPSQSPQNQPNPQQGPTDIDTAAIERYIQEQEKQARQNFINRQIEEKKQNKEDLSW